jgi:uncharacterized protein (DUF849 family)
MNFEVFISCAVTGAGDTAGKHPDLPVTPKQIADAALEAARAGAAIAHCHVRDPETGIGSRDPALYREVVERIRDSDTDVIINLTSGMGGDLALGHAESPMDFGNDTDLVGPMTRLVHVEELLPDICSLDCGTLNFGDGNGIYVSTPDMLRAGAKRIQSLGVKPELECFDTGHLWFAKQMDSPPMFQLCHGIPWGAPADIATMKTMVDSLPEQAVWAGFGIGRMQMPMVAQAVLLGGHVSGERGLREQRRSRGTRSHHRHSDGRKCSGPRRGPGKARAEEARVVINCLGDNGKAVCVMFAALV